MFVPSSLVKNYALEYSIYVLLKQNKPSSTFSKEIMIPLSLYERIASMKGGGRKRRKDFRSESTSLLKVGNEQSSSHTCRKYEHGGAWLLGISSITLCIGR